MLVEFWDSRDVWVLNLESGVMETKVFDSDDAPDSGNREHWNLSRGFRGDHIDEGFVYAYTFRPLKGQPKTDCIGVYFRDTDRDGVIDDYVPITHDHVKLMGLNNSDFYQ